MVKKYKRPWIFFLVIIGVAIWLPHFTIKAGTNPRIDLSDTKGVVALVGQVNSVSNDIAKNFNYLKLDGKTLTIDMETYKSDALSNQDRQQLMKETLTLLRNSRLSKQNKTRIDNFITSQDTVASSLITQLSDDTRPDYIRAMRVLGPFFKPLQVILGLAPIVLLIMLTATILLDISYLSLPVFQVVMNSSQEGNSPPKYISPEAYQSIKDAETNNRSSLGIYFGQRVKHLVIISILITILSLGGIFDFVVMIINLFSNIIG